MKHVPLLYDDGTVNQIRVFVDGDYYFVNLDENGIVTKQRPDDEEIAFGWYDTNKADGYFQRKLQSAADHAVACHKQDVARSRSLTKDDYQNAIDVQSACNLSGIVFSFAEVMQRICNDAYGTEARNTHPIAVLFAEQIHFLTGSSRGYGDAHAACTERSQYKFICPQCSGHDEGTRYDRISCVNCGCQMVREQD